MSDSAARPRQIAWQIIATEPDAARRLELAGHESDLVRRHVEIFNEQADMRIRQLRRKARHLAKLEQRAPTAGERTQAGLELAALRYLCQGWILDRMREPD